MRKKIETPYATVVLTDDDLVIVTWKENSEIDIEKAKAQIIAGKKITGNKKYPTLVDFSNIKSMTRESRMYLSSDESGNICTGVAALITSPLAMLMGNFFMGFNKTSYPFRLFTKREEALTWLRQIADKKEKTTV